MNPVEQRAEILIGVFERLLARESALGARLRTDAFVESGLSREMIDWAIEESLGLLTRELARLLREGRLAEAPDFVERAALVLSGNVFTAPAEPLLWHALGDVETRVRSSTRDGSFARAFLDSLELESPALRSRFNLHTFDREDHRAFDAFIAEVEVVTAYGSDETMDAISARLASDARIVRRGHGFGIGYLGSDAIADPSFARAASLDIAAYDQRGCRSPVAYFVDGVAFDAARFARDLALALDAIESILPRGELSLEAQSAERQWRDSMSALGTLAEMRTASVAVIDDLDYLSSIGYRNVQVIACSRADFERFVARAAKHIKVVGVPRSLNRTNARVAQVRALLPKAEIAGFGSMQRPSACTELEVLDALQQTP